MAMAGDQRSLIAIVRVSQGWSNDSTTSRPSSWGAVAARRWWRW
jgi:hypothetical protein